MKVHKKVVEIQTAGAVPNSA